MNWNPYWGPPGYPPPPQQPNVIYVPVQTAQPATPQTPMKPKQYRKMFGSGKKSPTLDDVVSAHEALGKLLKYVEEQKKADKPKEEKKATFSDKLVAFIILTFLGPLIGIGYWMLIRFLVYSAS